MSRKHHGEREHGRILDVTEETLSTTLEGDHAAGATLLYVDDAAEFEDDGTGGWLAVNGQVIQYDIVDDDAGTIQLVTGLTAAADDGDRVSVWSKLYGTEATIKTALVQVDGEDDNTDPVVATLGDAVQDLPEGLRGGAGESCTLQRISADDWEVTAIGGRPSSATGTKFEDQDTFTATAVGDQSFTLSHLPERGSVHLNIEGGPQTHTDFSVNYDTGVVTVPDSLGLFAAGDVFDFRYAYRKGVAADAVTNPPPTPLLRYRLDETSGTTVVDTGTTGLNLGLGGDYTLGQAPIAPASAHSIGVGANAGAAYPVGPGQLPDWPAFTVAAWFHPTAVDAYQMIFTIDTPTALEVTWGLVVTAGKIRVNTYQLGIQGGMVAAGGDYLAVADWDGATLRLKLNDVLVASTAYTGPIHMAATAQVQIGRLAQGSYPFTGRIDDCAAWNSRLTDDQETYLFTKGLPA